MQEIKPNFCLLMACVSEVVDLHSPDISVGAMRNEIAMHPMRLEETKIVYCFDSCTPLMAASYFGNETVLECLVSCGADIEAKNKVSKYYCL